jgi:hypothetical protein
MNTVTPGFIAVALTRAPTTPHWMRLETHDVGTDLSQRGLR